MAQELSLLMLYVFYFIRRQLDYKSGFFLQINILKGRAGGCFIKLVYQISQAYFSNSDLFSLDLVSESKITIAQAQSLWQLMLAN